MNPDLQNGLVSIVLPAYNTQEHFLREAVESVLAQSYSNWELLVIDDSTVAPVENIIRLYQDQRIKYFRNPENIGMAETRNAGLKNAAGEFVAFLDHDDIWMPEKLAEQLKVMQQTNCNMVYSPVTFFGNKNYNSKVQHNVSFADLIMGHNIVSCSCVLMRTSLIRQFDLKFSSRAVPADDYAMWLAAALYGGNIQCCQQCLVRYRSHENNVSAVNLVCYYPYEWILPDITGKLWKSDRPVKEKLLITFNIVRSRAWVLRKIVREDNTATLRKKIFWSIKAVMLYPVHPSNWAALFMAFMR